MKKLLLLGLVVFLLYATTASAVLLQPGSPIPCNGILLAALGYQETNDDSNISTNAYAPLLTYGFTDRLSGSAAYIFGNMSGDGLEVPPLGTIDVTLSGLTLGLNYCVFSEMSDQTPVSLKISGFYTGVKAKADSPSALEPIVPDSSTDISIWDARLVVSKFIVPFVPYLGFKYASELADLTPSSVTEIVIGSGLFLSPQFGFFAEYVSKNTNTEGSDTSTYQIGLSAAYVL